MTLLLPTASDAAKGLCILRTNRYRKKDVRVLSATKLFRKAVGYKDSKERGNNDNAILRRGVHITVLRG